MSHLLQIASDDTSHQTERMTTVFQNKGSDNSILFYNVRE